MLELMLFVSMTETIEMISYASDSILLNIHIIENILMGSWKLELNDDVYLTRVLLGINSKYCLMN